MASLTERISSFLGMKQITTQYLWDKANRNLIQNVLKEIVEFSESDSRATKAAELYRALREVNVWV